MQLQYVFLLAVVTITLGPFGAKKKIMEAENRYSQLDSTYRLLQTEWLVQSLQE